MNGAKVKIPFIDRFLQDFKIVQLNVKCLNHFLCACTSGYMNLNSYTCNVVNQFPIFILSLDKQSHY